jgi:hypothetical protein
MVRIRFTRALIVPAVIASLLVLPAAAQAAPREDQRDGGGGISLLGSLVDWVTSIWGAAGPHFDPTGQKPAPPPPESGISSPSADPTDLQAVEGR